MNFDLWFYRCWSVVVSALFVFYLVIVCKLHRRRHQEPFNASYFALWRSLGIVDLCVALSVWSNIKWHFLFDTVSWQDEDEGNIIILIFLNKQLGQPCPH